MADPKVNDFVNKALELFERMTGLEKVVTDGGGYYYKSKIKEYQAWDLADDFAELNRSRELDPTGLTTFMMLRGLTEYFLRQIKFSAYDLILNRKRVGVQVRLMEQLRDILEDPFVIDLIRGFQDDLRAAAKQYGVTGKALNELEDLLEDKLSLAYVRRDALRSIEDNLEAHQFVQGKADVVPPKYNPDVYEFWNINSLLHAMRAQKFSGISMVLIRDPEQELASFFCFAMRNGTTLTILTDRQEVPHPMYHRMSRRPDRNLAKRAQRNHFPYDLLDLKTTEDQKRLYAKARTQMVPLNAEAVALKPLRELPASTFVWTTLMFDLIRDKFWRQNHLLPEVSYTGEMILNPHALVGAEGALVKEGHYKPLQLPTLEQKDVTPETTASQWNRKSAGHNRYLYERYAAKVPIDLFNLVGEPAKQLVAAKAADETFLPIDYEEKTIWGNERQGRNGSIMRTGVGTEKIPIALTVETFNPLSFGRKEEIVRDRLWYARFNQIQAIQRLVYDEYEREREKIDQWINDRVRKHNREALIDAAVRGEFIATDTRFSDSEYGGGFPNDDENYRRDKTKNILSENVGDYWYGRNKVFGSTPKVIIGHYSESRRRWGCAIDNEKPASVFCTLQPTCPEALATVFGCTVDEMPWPLQHWFKDHPYHGNSILERLDPEDWKLKDPWHEHLRNTFGVCLSKSAYNERRKALGLPKRDFAAEEREAEAKRKADDY